MRILSGKGTAGCNRDSAERYFPHFLVAAVYVLAGARLFLLISRSSVNILASDQWSFDDATLFQQHSLWEMFRWQHGPHRQGLGALFQKLIDSLLHWDSHYEALAIGAIVLVAAGLALLLKIRLFGGYSDVVIPLLFLTPLLDSMKHSWPRRTPRTARCLCCRRFFTVSAGECKVRLASTFAFSSRISFSSIRASRSSLAL